MNKKSLLLATLSLALTACNGGGGSDNSNPPQPSPTPTPPETLPNVFDQNSVKDLKFDVLKLDNSTIVGSLNLTKVAGHVSYKIKLTNPNSFTLNINNIKFDNEDSYLFTRNNESDNCFNQSWYQQNNTSTTLAMPTNGSCSFYTTSPWIESYTTTLGASGAKLRHDFINYTATANGFGFSRAEIFRTNMWCNSGCSPLGNKASEVATTNNTINSKYFSWPISRSIFKNYSSASLIQNGNSIINLYAQYSEIMMQNYQVTYDASKLDLTTTAVEPVTMISNALNYKASGINTFAFNRNGNSGAFEGDSINYGNSGFGLRISNTTLDGYYFGGNDGKTYLSGLNGTIYKQNANGDDLSFMNGNYEFKWLKTISNNLPLNGTLYGADIGGNLIIKTGSKTACYLANLNYESIPALSNLEDIQTQPITSSKFLYSKNSSFGESFYKLNKQLVANPFSYQVSTSNCQTIPVGLTATDKIIITEKYAAVATTLGYFFVAPEFISNGENDDNGVN